MNATRLAMSADAAAQARTPGVTGPASRDAAYRRLVISIPGLDVRTLAAELRTERLANESRVIEPVGDLQRAA
jgi:hypothetical protein